jgi:hypothetical protein
MASIQQMAAIRAPKHFSIHLEKMNSRQVMGLVSNGLDQHLDAATSRKAWRITLPLSELPNQEAPSLQFQAMTTYPMAGTPGAIQLTCIVTNFGDQGIALHVDFSDSLGWQVGGSEGVAAGAMRLIHRSLAQYFGSDPGEQMWSMTTGTWVTGVQFNASRG